MLGRPQILRSVCGGFSRFGSHVVLTYVTAPYLPLSDTTQTHRSDSISPMLDEKGCAMDLTTTMGYVPGFPDTFNLRDLGGLAAADGRRVRPGLLYRGSALAGLTEAQRSIVDGFGLRVLLDLRAVGEVEGRADYVPQGVEYLRIGGMYDADGNELDFSPAGISRMIRHAVGSPEHFMRSLYVSMLFGNPAVHALVDRMALGRAPLYFHCTAGKDRTGVCAAIVLTLLGVPDDAIVCDFLLTNEYRASIINMAPQDMPAWVSELERQNWAKMNEVSEVDLRGALAEADRRHGGREAYLRHEFGLDEAALARMRDAYLA